MSKYLVKLLITLLVILRSPLVMAEHTFEDALNEHQAHLNQVVTCGEWKGKYGHGSFRIVEFDIWDMSLVFIQWIATDKDNKKYIVKSVSLDPFNDDVHGIYSLKNINCESVKDGAILKGHVINMPDNVTDKLEVKIFREVGKVRGVIKPSNQEVKPTQ